MTTSTDPALRSSSAKVAAGSVGTGSLTPASWAIRSAGIRGHSPASSRVNTSSLVPTPSTTSSWSRRPNQSSSGRVRSS
jgi:hypothetical protein